MRVGMHISNLVFKELMAECEYASSEEGIRDLLQHWNEEEQGAQVFLLVNQQTKEPEVILYRPDLEDPELARVFVLATSLIENYRCHYVTKNRKYIRTDVTKLS